MKILAIITDTHEVKKILKHLVTTGKSPPGVDNGRLFFNAEAFVEF